MGMPLNDARHRYRFPQIKVDILAKVVEFITAFLSLATRDVTSLSVVTFCYLSPLGA